MEKIIYYDKLGFIPSENLKIPEDYLEESKKKYELLMELENSDILRSEEGVEVRVYKPNLQLQKEFYRKTLTKTWPGIIVKKPHFHKFSLKNLVRHKSLLLKSLIFPLSFADLFSAEGTIGRMRKKDIELHVPLLLTPSSIDKDFCYLHELIHSIKFQHNSSDELVPYRIPGDLLGINTFNHIYHSEWFSYAKLGLNTPLLTLSFLFPLTSPFYIPSLCSFSVIGGYIRARRKFKKFDRFVEKCEKEGLNPYYLLLRSDLSEYDLSKDIYEQLKKKKGLRWEIIRVRLENDLI